MCFRKYSHRCLHSIFGKHVFKKVKKPSKVSRKFCWHQHIYLNEVSQKQLLVKLYITAFHDKNLNENVGISYTHKRLYILCCDRIICTTPHCVTLGWGSIEERLSPWNAQWGWILFKVIFDFLFNLDIQKKNLFRRCHLSTEDKIRILKIFGSIMPWCMFGYIFTRFLYHFFLATKTIKTWICKLECFLYLHKRDILMVKHVPWENSGIGKTIVSDVFSYQYTFSNFSCIFLDPNNFLQFEF